MEEIPEMHDNCESIIVNPMGQLQMVRECWCKLYHVFGPKIQNHETTSTLFAEDIECIYLMEGESYQQPQNMYLSNKLKKKIYGPGILFRKAQDLSLEKAKSLLVQ